MCTFYYAARVYTNRLLLWVQICDATGCFVKALPMGQNIVLDKLYTKTTRTDINSRTLQAAVIVGQTVQVAAVVKLDFRNLKSTRNVFEI